MCIDVFKKTFCGVICFMTKKPETCAEGSSVRKKRSGRKIWLSVLLSFILLVGCIAYIFRAEIRLAYFAMTTSKEAVQSKQVENDKKTQELLEQIAVQTMRDLTDEERKLLASGELSAADALALIQGITPAIPAETTALAQTNAPVETTGPAAFSVPVETTAIGTTDAAEIPQKTDVSAAVIPEVPSDSEPEISLPVTIEKPVAITTATSAATTATTVSTTVTTTAASTIADSIDKTTLQNRQSEIIAEIYLLRATYLNEIDALIAQTKAAYIALPKEQHTLTGKLTIVEQMIPQGNALEDASDAKMDVLLAELASVLKQLGSSTAIIDEIRQTYDEQKLLKKTELYNEYMPKLN